MRIRLLLFVFASVVFIGKGMYGQVNEYHPFTPNGGEWSVLYESYLNEAQEYDYRAVYKTQYIGDTVISEKTYFIVKTFKTNYPENADTFRLWEDTLEKRVYVNHKYRTDGLDSLLYDFSVDTGDIVANTFAFAAFYPDAKVVSIDSILIDGNYRKKINIEFTAIYFADPYLGEDTLLKTFWIEGIGGENGLVANNGHQQYVPPTYYTLLCYSEFSDDVYVQPSEFADCDSTFYYYSVYDVGKSRYNIYPNPAKNYFVIQSGENLKEETEVQILNTSGAVIKTTKLQAGTNSLTVSVAEIPQGMYVIKIFNYKNLLAVKKLIINSK